MPYSIKWQPILKDCRSMFYSAKWQRIKLQILFHLTFEEHGYPDTMRFWLQDDAPLLIPITGGICIFLDVPNTSLCSMIDNSQISEDRWHLLVTLIICPLSRDKPANKSVPSSVTIHTMYIVTLDSADLLAGLSLHPGGGGSQSEPIYKSPLQLWLFDSSKMSVFTSLYSNFDFFHLESTSPTGVDLNKCPRGDQTWAKLAKILHVDWSQSIHGELSTLQQKKKCFLKQHNVNVNKTDKISLNLTC